MSIFHMFSITVNNYCLVRIKIHTWRRHPSQECGFYNMLHFKKTVLVELSDKHIVNCGPSAARRDSWSRCRSTGRRGGKGGMWVAVRIVLIHLGLDGMKRSWKMHNRKQHLRSNVGSKAFVSFCSAVWTS